MSHGTHTNAPRRTDMNESCYADTLQHTATHCNTLQHTATHCNTLQHTATPRVLRGWTSPGTYIQMSWSIDDRCSIYFVTHVNESWHTHVNESWQTQMNESWHTQVNESWHTHMNKSWHTHKHEARARTHEWVMTHIRMSHGTHTWIRCSIDDTRSSTCNLTLKNESWHTHIWISRVSHMDESCHTNEWAYLCTKVTRTTIRVTHVNESCVPWRIRWLIHMCDTNMGWLRSVGSINL